MKCKIVLFLLSFFTMACCSNAQVNKPVYLTIENKMALTYTDNVVSIPWVQVVKAYPLIDTGNLKITDVLSKREIEFQLEYAGSKTVQNLLVQVSIGANSSLKLLLQKGKHAPFITKTYGRFVPERKGDFAWENDQIAYRMYGKELEATPAENAYGIDVWVKRATKMILNERYKRDDYHVDHGDGLDYYSVGFTLGAGNIAPYMADSIWYSKNFTGYTILDNGPLRTTFQLNYDAWNVAGKNVTATKTISLDAGTQLNKITVAYRYEGSENLPVVVGIVKRAEAGVTFLDEQLGIEGYWEPQHGADGTTGIGCIIPAAVTGMRVTGKQLLAVSEIKKNIPFVYYAGAVWDKAGHITSSGQWFNYLKKQQQLLMNAAITIRL